MADRRDSLNVMALVRLWVQDVDFNYGILLIGNGKGGKHRQVALAPQLHASLRRHMEFMH